VELSVLDDGGRGLARVASGRLCQCQTAARPVRNPLALNSLWSVLFFGLQNPGAAVIEIILLWAAILATLVAFWKRSRWAGGLLVPYLAWVD